MSEREPTPPSNASSQLIDVLVDQDTDTLRDIARYAERLAEHRVREQRLRKADDETGQIEEQSADLPDDVPTKATLTVKEINDNRYYYWQWRDGEKIRSKYKGPVNPDK